MQVDFKKALIRGTAALGLGAVVLSQSACSTTDARLIGGGLGAYIANEASDGNSYATAAGAAIGAGVGGSIAARRGSCTQTATYDGNGNLIGHPSNCSRETSFPGNVPLPGQ